MRKGNEMRKRVILPKRIKTVKSLLALALVLTLTSSCSKNGDGESNKDRESSIFGDTEIEIIKDDTNNSETSANEYYEVTEELKDPVIINSSLESEKDKTKEFKLEFKKDWNLIKDKTYKDKLESVFYKSYPKCYKRWATPNSAKTIKINTDKSYDGIAQAVQGGDEIDLSVDYANENPDDIGFLAHEAMHNLLCYDVDLTWWEECLASYGRFRYFQWTEEDTVDVRYDYCKELRNWQYDPYGDCMLFFAYMDYYYPTKKDENGNIKYGLIDSINKGVQSGIITSDGFPKNKTTEFNKIVKKTTGFDTIDEVRKEYIHAIKDGSWKFKGFAEYEDNFLTEEKDDKADYPMMNITQHDGKSGELYDGLTFKGYTDNILSGAKIIRSSGYINDDERDEYLIDGDTSTKWCAELSDVKDLSYIIDGTMHFAVIDLGSKKDFNSYTLYNAGYVEDSAYNAFSWELYASEDGHKFKSVDYQELVTENVATIKVDKTSARYLMLKVYNPDLIDGTLRLYELEAGMIPD